MGAWIEIKLKERNIVITVVSHPTMGAWIEITKQLKDMFGLSVAPHDGCVD